MKLPNKETLDALMKETGSAGLILIISNSQLPCPDQRAGEACTTEHDVQIVSNGIHPSVFPYLLQQFKETGEPLDFMS